TRQATTPLRLYKFIGEQLINADVELAQWAWEELVNPQTAPHNPKTQRMFFLNDLGVELRYKDRTGVERPLMHILAESSRLSKVWK
ncbi:MAG: hypothetical protein IPK60_21210, partial [Sandaracinaceae bacterium]|nr:hypothetical protein [Sandaracinaceae bacterium]